MDIGNQIKKRRTELHMTQDELAEKLDVVRTTVSNWEVGRNYPDLQMIVKISDVLDVSLDQLLKGDEQLVQQISEDTTVRKIQSKNIRKLKIVIIVLAVLAAAFLTAFLILRWGNSWIGYVTDSDQVSDMYISDDNILHIDLNLPDNVTVAGYETGLAENHPNTIRIGISLFRDEWGDDNKHSYEIPIYTDGDAEDDYFSKDYIEQNNIQHISLGDEYGKELYTIDLPGQ